MPETPDELYRRSADALRTPAVEEWDSWPFPFPEQDPPAMPDDRLRADVEALRRATG